MKNSLLKTKNRIKKIINRDENKEFKSYKDIDPSSYSTTDVPAEVPCQRESYFYALNTFVKDGDKVLDVGMGLGYGMNILSIKAKEVHAVDVDKKAVEHCKKVNLGKNPKVKKLSLYDGYSLPYRSNYFDVVTCVDVVEHVEDYDRFIDELLRVSKRVVFFATPNRRPEYTNPDGTPMNYYHLREWSFQELNKIILGHSKKIKWSFLEGPYDGPFKIKEKASKETLVLMPALFKQ
jgi:2-polyprenyl-3-methyl-5-hydroxy-6-metoxy-1,4-benzoquinol methylase